MVDASVMPDLVSAHINACDLMGQFPRYNGSLLADAGVTLLHTFLPSNSSSQRWDAKLPWQAAGKNSGQECDDLRVAIVAISAEHPMGDAD